MKNFKCYACGHVGPDNDFPVFYGALGADVGICRTCSRKGILVSVQFPKDEPDKPILIGAPYGEDGLVKDIEEMFDILNKIVASDKAPEVVSYYTKSIKLMSRIHKYKLSHINPPKKEGN